MPNPDQHKPNPSLSPPRGISPSALRLALVEGVKDAFANWIVDIASPSILGENSLRARLADFRKLVESSAEPILNRLAESVEESIASEIDREALLRDPDVGGEEVAQEVIEKLDRELSIIKNEIRLASSREEALLSKNQAKQREELLSRCRRGLEFAIGETSTPVFFDSLRPMLNAVRALGVTDINDKMAKALEDYGKSARFRAPVFERILNAVTSDQELAAKMLAGLSQPEACQLIRNATRDAYPTPSDYRAARGRASAASGRLMNDMVETLERSGNSFAEAVAMMFRAGPLAESIASTPPDIIRREIEAIYGEASHGEAAS